MTMKEVPRASPDMVNLEIIGMRRSRKSSPHVL